MAQIDGKELKVGDYVNFKCDIEQGGRIKKIEGTRLTLESANGFYGDYIGGDTTTVQSVRDCWL